MLAALAACSDREQPPNPSVAPEAAIASAAETAETGEEEGAYPPGYVDDLPLDDAPPLPASATYQPQFEMPDLFGDEPLESLEPLTHLALGLIAITVGAHLNIRRLRNAVR